MVYVGMDVHRNRNQVALVDEGGKGAHEPQRHKGLRAARSHPRSARFEVSPRYRSHCRPGTEAASEMCQPATGATVSTMNRSRTPDSVHHAD
jgi:hypothetical protein